MEKFVIIDGNNLMFRAFYALPQLANFDGEISNAVFGFTSKNLYILESALPNNATYVLQNNWETISQLSKAEILSQDLHSARIIHSENWQKNFERIMEGNDG